MSCHQTLNRILWDKDAAWTINPMKIPTAQWYCCTLDPHFHLNYDNNTNFLSFLFSCTMALTCSIVCGLVSSFSALRSSFVDLLTRLAFVWLTPCNPCCRLSLKWVGQGFALLLSPLWSFRCLPFAFPSFAPGELAMSGRGINWRCTELEGWV